jgi:hypothetical protein
MGLRLAKADEDSGLLWTVWTQGRSGLEKGRLYSAITPDRSLIPDRFSTFVKRPLYDRMAGEAERERAARRVFAWFVTGD